MAKLSGIEINGNFVSTYCSLKNRGNGNVLACGIYAAVN